jgi:hypothetical protein
MKIVFPLLAMFIASALVPAAFGAEPWTFPKTKEECLAKEGKWEKLGMPGDPMAGEGCIVNAPDAGKTCSSSTQCLARWCRPDSKKGWLPAGNKAPGVCEAFRPVNGCIQAVEKGIIVDIPCAM